MAICKFCAALMTWGQTSEGSFIPLIPIGEEGEASRDYQDEAGLLRSTHRQVCTNRAGPLVRVSKLARSIEAKDIVPLPTLSEHVEQLLKRKAAKRKTK